MAKENSPWSLEPVDYDPFAEIELSAAYPAGEPQREIWIAAVNGDEANCAYNESISLHFHGALKVDAFTHAIRDLVARHESLHAEFSADGATYCVLSDYSFDTQVVDLHHLNPSDQQQRIEHFLKKDVTTPFDLQHGPLFRVTLLLMSDTESVAIICAHHIICDGLSWAVLLPDLAKLYQAHSNERPHLAIEQLPNATRYSDYLAHIDSSEFQANVLSDIAYWQQQYADGCPQLSLPIEGKRPSVRTFSAQRIDYEIASDKVKQLKALGSSQGSTFVVTLMAAYKLFLARLSGQQDFALGVMAAGQSVTGFNELVGHCVNMLPVRSQLDMRRSFVEYLGQLRGVMFDAFDHQSASFGTILKHLNVARDASRVPLCPVIFNIDQAATDYPFANIKVDFITNHRAYENFEVFLNAVENTGNRLVLECTFNSDLFSREVMQSRLKAFDCLIDSILTQPDRAMNALEIVPIAEQNILNRWNETGLSLDNSPSLVELLMSQVAAAPSKVAVLCDGKSLTYGELDEQSTQLANLLIAEGVTPSDMLGLAVDRSVDMLVCMVGILKAGAAYIPLDASYPDDRLNYMLEHSSAPVLLVSQRHAQRFSNRTKLLVIEELLARLNSASSEWQPISIIQRSPAYVIYTSGSTGKPKGVEVPQAAVVNFLLSMASKPGLNSTDRMLALTTLSFDIAVLELLLPLSVGATTVIATKQQCIDGHQLSALIQSESITAMQATPATWRMLLDEGWQGKANLTALCGGEAMPADLCEQLLAKVGSLWNMYGPTETTVWSTCTQVTDPADITIGKPIANTQIFILNEAMQLNPVGIPGELYIGGDGVTTGYLHNTQLTRDRFVEYQGKRIYRTGDIARWRRDGEIECLGRVDHQVKLRGFRIELGEIESALMQHAALGQCVVDVKSLSENDKRLVAYYQTQDASQMPDVAELRHLCEQQLPEYMVPQHYVKLDVIPLTLNGKVDRNALPLDDILNTQSEQVMVSASTELEHQILDIWQSVLKRQSISMTDNFFNLGGHSLLANQIISRIRQTLDIAIPLTFIFQYPTIQGMAEQLSQADGVTDNSLPTIVKNTPAFPARLSVSQNRLWFLQQLYPDSSLFNQVGVWRIGGSLNPDVFAQAVEHLVQRQLILKTRFSSVDGMPQMHEVAKQTIIQPATFEWSSERNKEQELIRYIETCADTPLDFGRGEYIAIQLIPLSKTEYVLMVVSHPIIWDGWSFDILLKELSSLYESIESSQPNRLEELLINYMDYPNWHQQWLSSGVQAKQLDFWKTHLEGASPSVQLPRDRQRPSLPTYQGHRESLFLEKSYVDKINDVAHQHNATLYMILMAAFVELLYRYSEQTDVTFATQVQGRIKPEFNNVIGPFVNTVLLRQRLDKHGTRGQLIDAIKDSCVQSFNHQDVPFERVLEHTAFSSGEKSAPPYQVMFTFQDTTNRRPEFAGRPMSQMNHNIHSAYTDLIFWLKETGNGLYGGFDYSTELFNAKTMAWFKKDYLQVLDEMVRQPETIIEKTTPFKQQHAVADASHKIDQSSGFKHKEPDAEQNRSTPVTKQVEQTESQLASQTVDTVRTLWESLLNISPIEMQDNFFELGGNSLSAMMLIDKLKQQLGVTISPRLLLTGTLRSLLSELDSHQAADQESMSVDTVVQELNKPSLTTKQFVDEPSNISAKPRSEQRLSPSWFSKLIKRLTFASTINETGKTNVSDTPHSVGHSDFNSHINSHANSTSRFDSPEDYEQFFASTRDQNLFRGVYQTFEQAEQSIPQQQTLGYNTDEAAKLYKDRLNQVYPADYPCLYWLEKIFADGTDRIFDFGGHVGVAYYAYQSYLQYPQSLQWTVCDVPSVVKEGQALAHRKQRDNILFTTEFSDLTDDACLFASGSLQYLPLDLADQLKSMSAMPGHILLNLLPVHAEKEYFTLQNIGNSFCAYHIFAEQLLINRLEAMGYTLIDQWKNPEKACLIPFHQNETLDYYTGFYFKRSS